MNGMSFPLLHRFCYLHEEFTLSDGSYKKFSGYALVSEHSQKGSVEQVVVEVPSFIYCSWSERNIAVPMGEGLMPLWMSMCTSVLSRIFEMLRWWKTQMINFEGNLSLVFRQYLNVMNFQHPGQGATEISAFRNKVVFWIFKYDFKAYFQKPGY